MTAIKLIVSVLLIGVIYWLSTLLIADIKGPIIYETERSKRYETAKQKLIDIRTAQLMYKKNEGEFLPNIDDLAEFVKTGSIQIEKVIGDPNDSTVVSKIIKEDVLVLDTLFKGNAGKASNMVFVPYSDGIKFDCDAGFIEKNKVNVAVFEVSTALKHVYNGLSKKYFDPNKKMTVGSMSEPKTSGNFE